jgi:DNA polymerase-3 subunit delta
MMHALELLGAQTVAPVAIAVLFGEDRFLRLESVRRLIADWGGDEEADLAVSRFEGGGAALADVLDAWATASLFSAAGRRVVVVDGADDLVKAHRGELEEIVRPSHANSLILCVDAWLATTRLYKLVEKVGLNVDCNPPTATRGKSKQLDEAKAIEWLVSRARSEHGCELSKSAAREMLDLNPCDFGLFDQQLAKMACCATAGKAVTPENVREWIGGWRMNTIWQTIDAAVDGDAPLALKLLSRLLQSGEHPLALFGQISWSLRRYGEVLELYDRGQRNGSKIRLGDCIAAAGFRPWGNEQAAAEARLKRMGPNRSRRIFRYLLETDLALKGSHSNEVRGRYVLERLIARLAVPQSKSPERVSGTTA